VSTDTGVKHTSPVAGANAATRRQQFKFSLAKKRIVTPLNTLNLEHLASRCSIEEEKNDPNAILARLGSALTR
jgi:hypothetical protein